MNDPNKLARWQQGLFWEYQPKTEKPPAIPPKPVWLDKDYLPNFEEACNADLQTYDLKNLWFETYSPLIFDVELYPNYFCVCFRNADTDEKISFEMTKEKRLNIPYLKFIIENYVIVGFNVKAFDVPILKLALAGKDLDDLYDASLMLINEGLKPHIVLKSFKVYGIKVNFIDLIEVCPLSSTMKYHGSLKLYGGRVHSKRILDLPVKPGTRLTDKQMILIHWYCFNDLDNTLDLFRFLKKDIALREMMGAEYGGIDLRSKSDAQIAEYVIAQEMTRINGVKPERKELPMWIRYKYDPPAYLNFKTEQLRYIYNLIVSQEFVLDENGSPSFISESRERIIALLKFTFGETEYQVGIGGLHSTEERRAVMADAEYMLVDRDVESYYPRIILNNRLFPDNLGPNFLTVYDKIVKRRLEAKAKGKAGDDTAKREEAALKITINGSFGKFGNQYSLLYSPKLLIQVTITGQLSLLYLIEKIELAGIRVISANTDGIVIKCPRGRKQELDAIIAQWEQETCFKTEETQYHCLASRSVNDYMAVKIDKEGKLTCKGKGKLGRGINALFKNPESFICASAIEKYLEQGIPIETTIRECKDIKEFLTVRKVAGGACKDGVFVGKVVRFYYSTETDTPLITALKGHTVSKSEGAKPCMILPDEFPIDLDFAQYIREAKKMLDEMGLIY